MAVATQGAQDALGILWISRLADDLAAVDDSGIRGDDDGVSLQAAGHHLRLALGQALHIVSRHLAGLHIFVDVSRKHFERERH